MSRRIYLLLQPQALRDENSAKSRWKLRTLMSRDSYDFCFLQQRNHPLNLRVESSCTWPVGIALPTGKRLPSRRRCLIQTSLIVNAIVTPIALDFLYGQFSCKSRWCWNASATWSLRQWRNAATRRLATSTLASNFTCIRIRCRRGGFTSVLRHDLVAFLITNGCRRGIDEFFHDQTSGMRGREGTGRA